MVVVVVGGSGGVIVGGVGSVGSNSFSFAYHSVAEDHITDVTRRYHCV